MYFHNISLRIPMISQNILHLQTSTITLFSNNPTAVTHCFTRTTAVDMKSDLIIPLNLHRIQKSKEHIHKNNPLISQLRNSNSSERTQL